MKQQYELDDQAGQRVRERNWLRVVTRTTTLCTDTLLLLLAWLSPSLLWYELVSVLCVWGIGIIFMGGALWVRYRHTRWRERLQRSFQQSRKTVRTIDSLQNEQNEPEEHEKHHEGRDRPRQPAWWELNSLEVVEEVAGWTWWPHFLFMVVVIPVTTVGVLARVIPFPEYLLDAVPGILYVAEGLEVFYPLALYGLNAKPKEALPAIWWGVTWGMLIGSWTVGMALDWVAGSAMKMLTRVAFLSLLLFGIGYMVSEEVRRRSQTRRAMEPCR